ncbi:flagellar type III secretion system pore protein FliP [Parvularcula sp. IMCC14364]|uniref:flagellar type III secretion system pore protein FliP n=1 Tax=Parvularcula sp. IMCC14364 TaxID=3067902 RepID=UPI0027403889|nr:flagellar type III secretion system pore protein FliP [Parvularcula sp. IMCC14364]
MPKPGAKLLICLLAGVGILLALVSGASAQELPVIEDEGGALSARIIQLFLIITVLSLAPGIAMMITCLPFMVIVFSFLRQAIGLQQAPPNMMVMSLAMFLTFFIMEPVFMESWETGIKPLMDDDITEEQAFENTMEPFRGFMENRVEPETLDRLAAALPNREFSLEGEKPLSLLVTSFMLSEIKRAFQIGFVIFLPFLIIDLIVASILMAMGMMMVPPAIVSLPFKLAFFVMADGWMKLTEALLMGYAG